MLMRCMDKCNAPCRNEYKDCHYRNGLGYCWKEGGCEYEGRQSRLKRLWEEGMKKREARPEGAVT